MQFSSKTYKILKTKNYLKENNLLFFVNSIPRNSNDEIIIEQNLKKFNLNYYKIFNKTSKTRLNNSIYINSNELINSITLFIKPIFNYIEFKKSTLFSCFEPLLIYMLAIKFNNKIYSMTQLKEVFTLHYKDSKLLFFQFNSTNFKILLLTKLKNI
jgi:hypothetical protein